MFSVYIDLRSGDLSNTALVSSLSIGSIIFVVIIAICVVGKSLYMLYNLTVAL